MQDDEPISFSGTDYDGVVVDCPVETRRSKILRDHPEMDGRRDDVRRAIVDPEIVFQDRDFPDRKHHLRRAPDGSYVKVVAGYSYTADEPRGTVITTFLLGRLRARPRDSILYVQQARGES